MTIGVPTRPWYVRKRQTAVRHLHRGRSNDALDGVFFDGLFRGGVPSTVHKSVMAVPTYSLALAVRSVQSMPSSEMKRMY